MKSLLYAIVSLFIFFLPGCSGLPKSGADEVDKRLEASIQQTLKMRNIGADIEVERLAKLNKPQGFYFYKITIKDSNRRNSQEQYIFFNGKYIAPDFINYENNLSLSRELQFEHSYTEIDTSNLPLINGVRGAKNIIVKITDFECQYCRAANAYLEDKLKEREDVAVYIVHFPLTNIHKKAELLAKIFEAGNLMEKNFSHELFSNDALLSMTDTDIIAYFASKSGDDSKFNELVASDDIAQRIRDAVQLAQSFGVNATPVIYINGKRIEGFDASLINNAIESFK